MELELLLMKMELKDKLDGKMGHCRNGLVLNLDIYIYLILFRYIIFFNFIICLSFSYFKFNEIKMLKAICNSHFPFRLIIFLIQIKLIFSQEITQHHFGFH